MRPQANDRNKLPCMMPQSWRTVQAPDNGSVWTPELSLCKVDIARIMRGLARTARASDRRGGRVVECAGLEIRFTGLP